MEELYKDIKHLLDLLAADGENEGGWSAFSVDPNDFPSVEEMVTGIEKLKNHLPKEYV